MNCLQFDVSDFTHRAKYNCYRAERLGNCAKKSIDDKISTVWLWLSYHRTWPPIRRLEDERAFNLFMFLGVVVGKIVALTLSIGFIDFVYAWLFPEKFISQHRWVLLVITTGGTATLLLLQTPVFVIIYLLRKILRRSYVFITDTSNTPMLFIRAFGILLIMMFLFEGPYRDYQNYRIYMDPTIDITNGIDNSTMKWLHYFAKYWIMGSVATILRTTVMQIGYLLAYMMSCICIYIAVISVVAGILKLCEMIILKLIEYDRGVVIGAASFLGAVGAVLKFSPGQPGE